MNFCMKNIKLGFSVRKHPWYYAGKDISLKFHTRLSKKAWCKGDLRLSWLPNAEVLNLTPALKAWEQEFWTDRYINNHSRAVLGSLFKTSQENVGLECKTYGGGGTQIDQWLSNEIM